MKKKSRKILFTAVKLLIAVALLAWVVGKVHWNDYSQLVNGQPVHCPGFKSSLSEIDVPLLGFAMLGFLVSWLITAVRWWLLLKIQDIRIKLWEAVRLTFLGQFFNIVVPGTVGGDLVKAWYVSKHTTRKAGVLVSVFVDRVLGLTELTLLAGVMIVLVLALGLRPFQDLRLPAISIAVVTGIVILTLTFVLSHRVRRFLRLEKFYQHLSFAKHIAAAGDAAKLYGERIGALTKAIAITFGAHVVWVGAIALIGMSLHMQTAWYNYFVYIPLIYIIGAIPITPGGVGLVENFYLFFFVPPASASAALALALLARLIPILWSTPGIAVAVTGPKLPKAEAMEAELEAEELPAK